MPDAKWIKTEISESYLSELDKTRAVLNTRRKEYFNTLDQHIKTLPWPDEKSLEIDQRIFIFLQDVIVRGDLSLSNIILHIKIRLHSEM